jgi:hypothetical protein
MDDVSRAGSPSDAVVARLQRMEETVAGLGREVRTRRLVVADRQDDERIVGEVEPGGVAELRLDLPGCLMGNRTSVLLFSNPGTDAYDLPPGTGVHMWIDGEPIKEFDVWLNAELEE